MREGGKWVRRCESTNVTKYSINIRENHTGAHFTTPSTFLQVWNYT